MTPYHASRAALARLGLSFFTLLTLLWSPALHAQPQDDVMPVHVQLSFEKNAQPPSMENIPVFLRAARVKGPFEPTDPEPAKEWSALTDASGRVTFSQIPSDLATQGLRLQAVASWDDSLFKTPQVTPARGIQIDVPIYERGFDLSTFKIKSVRMVIEPWEDYLVYTQMWELAVEGEQALDTTLIPDPDFKEGIPIRLPVKASGINYNGTEGTHKIINSTIYWHGVIKPGQPVSFQLRYSIPIKDAAFVYDQQLDYKTQKLELIIPLETNYKNKLPRLNGLELRAPGFKPEDIQSGFNIPGLRPDREFIYATRLDLPRDARIKFQLTNLPYGRPLGPWIALCIGLLGIVIVIIFAQRERRDVARGNRQTSTIEVLEQELAGLFREVDLIEQDRHDDAISATEYDRESAILHTRIGLILKKLDELRGEEPGSQGAAHA